jgi:hypothetical protein
MFRHFSNGEDDIRSSSVFGEMLNQNTALNSALDGMHSKMNCKPPQIPSKLQIARNLVETARDYSLCV